MTYARARTAANVNSGTSSLRSVLTISPTKRLTLTPVNSAARNAARNVAVPALASQLNTNTAAYGAFAVVTGGVRMMALCRSGTLMRSVGVFRARVLHAVPHTMTRRTR